MVLVDYHKLCEWRKVYGIIVDEMISAGEHFAGKDQDLKVIFKSSHNRELSKNAGLLMEIKPRTRKDSAMTITISQSTK